ncbi:hypothetical protein GMSM_11180 [Geomonas sp. Red276]
MAASLLWSYLLAVAAVVTVLYNHLLPAVLSGLAVYVLTAKLARHLPGRWGKKAHAVALAGIILVVALAVSGGFIGLWLFVQGHEGMGELMGAAAERLEDLKRSLPAWLTPYVPDSMEQVRQKVATVLGEHSRNLSHAGVWGVRTVAHVLFGLVIGAIAVLHRFQRDKPQPPLAAGLEGRLGRLTEAFEKVVFAQVKISLLNTVLTTLYLAVILPLCGVHLPMVTLLILLTFVAGLLPVVGNLISNSIIVLLSLGESPAVALASVGFLLFVHKLEYFTNAKIVGGRVDASAWELLTAMLVLEAIFGMEGMIAAPIVYAWLKAELTEQGLV